ncbi:MAG: toxin-activating lysine-acyltransferase [Pseudomonadota bacterium]
MTSASQKPLGVDGSDFLSPSQFTDVLGAACWLMTMSKAHRLQPISLIEDRILPGLLLKQFRLIKHENQPKAFLSWATVSDDVLERFELDNKLTLKDWRSGPNIRVVECISPFADPDLVRSEFLKKIATK